MLLQQILKNLEYGRKMVYAGSPSFLVLGSGGGHIPPFELLL